MSSLPYSSKELEEKSQKIDQDIKILEKDIQNTAKNNNLIPNQIESLQNLNKEYNKKLECIKQAIEIQLSETQEKILKISRENI